MSYILTALRRAEEERRDGSRDAPISRSGPAAYGDVADRGGKRSAWMGAAAGLLAVLAVAPLLFLLKSGGTTERVDPVGAEVVDRAPAPVAKPIPSKPDNPERVAAVNPAPVVRAIDTAKRDAIPEEKEAAEFAATTVRELPAINVTGYIYFENRPENSKLFVDGVVYRRHSRLGESLIIESFHRDHVMLRYFGELRRLTVN